MNSLKSRAIHFVLPTAWSVLFSLLILPARGQEPEHKAEAMAVPQTPAQIELLETKYRFEANGDSRKEVQARVRINNELGVQQFARLKFDYSRSFQSVEIPLVRITHPGGGIAETLPSAVADNPNPAVVDFPAYQDVRVKSVRILGLSPGDLLEYRVITTTTHAPLSPDFWLEHSFDRSGVVSQESFELDLPALPNLRVQINPATAPIGAPDSGRKETDRTVYRWSRNATLGRESSSEAVPSTPDIGITTFSSWNQLAERLSSLLIPSEQETRELRDKAAALAGGSSSASEKIEALYDFVSKEIRTVDLPLGETDFHGRRPADTLESGYGSAEDKFVLFAALGSDFFGPVRAGLVPSSGRNETGEPASPGRFTHLLTVCGSPFENFWMDLNMEVAPFRMIPTQFRDKPVFLVGPSVGNRWQTVVASLPFPSSQKVEVRAALDVQGRLNARVAYVLRGDNELLLRIAFHQTQKEKWKDVAQLLALSDGFRGQVTTVTASDPYDTKGPFSVEYEVTQPNFVNWEKKPVRIPAILPLLGLPDPPPANSTAPFNLGTPLSVDLHAKLKLPDGASARVPPGTSVQRDYAEFSSRYSAENGTLFASRHLRFLMREIPAGRAADYKAFLRAVQNDEAQEFTLQRGEPGHTAEPPKP